MKLSVIKFGRPAYQEYETLVARYVKRLTGWYDLAREEIRISQNKQELQAMKRILAPDPGRITIALDERGKVWSSPQLAENLKVWQEDPAIKQLTFIIGGPYGLSEELKEKSDVHWSLSKAVYTSDLAWLVVWEQLYRAGCINRGIAYHHE